MKNNSLEHALRHDGFLTIDLSGKGIEVKPGRYAPIYINMKATWDDPHLVAKMSYELQKLCLDCDCVIGIETGGSPYAVNIAQNLGISLILARKNSKKDLGILAGNLNNSYKKFAIIDDVLASGRSMKPAFDNIKSISKEVVCISVLSYNLDSLISKEFEVSVRSLYKIEDLLNLLGEEEKIRLIPYINKYREILKEKMKSK